MEVFAKVSHMMSTLNNNSHVDKCFMKDFSECIGEIGRSHSTLFSTWDLTYRFWAFDIASEIQAHHHFYSALDGTI